ncbi:hypothetical protein ONZ45_g166 [Pleurotus djamor]|nr:hypothetical protein ONZ45_g166 [Pleurotus djamor]
MWPFHDKGYPNDYELVSSGSDRRHPPIRRHRNTYQFYILATAIFLLCASLAILLVDAFVVRRSAGLDSGYTQSLVNYLWPVGLPNRTDNWENENNKAMHAMFTCMATESCKEKQTSVIILAAMSVLISLRELGYTALYAPDTRELERTYRQFPHLVKAILVEGSDVLKCFDDDKCIKNTKHPLGIPVWKMFTFHFWTGPRHPLGNAWTLSPENYPLIDPVNSAGNYYLGYSIERSCMATPFVHVESRPMQAYVLAKQISYLYNSDFAWKGMSLKPSGSLQIVSGMRNDTNGPSSIPEGWTNLGRLNKTQFYEQLGRSRVLIGIGRPFMSPSPYDALCMGVPFINPIFTWDEGNPDDRSEWRTQHDGLKYENPPHVYHVRKGDRDGFWDAVNTAILNPIPQYIVPNMTMEALKHRLEILIEGDWRSKAEALLEERRSSGKGKVGLLENFLTLY